MPKGTSNNTSRSNRLVSPAEALEIGIQLKADWTRVDLYQFRIGLEQELNKLNQTEDSTAEENFLHAGSIALSHLYNASDYYTRA